MKKITSFEGHNKPLFNTQTIYQRSKYSLVKKSILFTKSKQRLIKLHNSKSLPAPRVGITYKINFTCQHISFAFCNHIKNFNQKKKFYFIY